MPLKRFISLIVLQEVPGSYVAGVWGELSSAGAEGVSTIGHCVLAYPEASLLSRLPDTALPWFPTVFESLVPSVGGTCFCLNCLSGGRDNPPFLFSLKPFSLQALSKLRRILPPN